MSISAVSCLICCQLHTPARVQRIKLENENIFEGDATDGCDSVENQRNVICLLRKLLEIPKDVCSYLRQSYGDPCLGVSCCDSCSVLVDKGRMTIQELSLLQKQLENVKNELKIAIVNSQQPNSNCKNEMKGATVIVRSYIKSANRENIFIQNCDEILAVKLTDCCRIPSKSPSVIGENYFGVEADDNIDVKIHSSPYSCHEDDVENDPNEDGIYPNFSEPLARSISTRPFLSKHKIDHMKTCNICGNICTSPAELKNHQRIHTGKKPYECKLCGYRSSFSSCLSRHMRTHKRENHNAKKVLSNDILNKHKSIDKEAFSCNVCGERFKLHSVLKDHQKSHAAEKPLECNICGNLYSETSSLNRHMLTHTKGKPHKCETCGKCFTTLKNLQDHQRTHTGEKPLVCEFCRKRYSNLETLKKHKLIHTRPRTCKTCGKVFASLSILIIHQRSHTGERPYECKICGNRFTQASGLRRHMLTHTGEKRHKCETCGKCFAIKTYLQDHHQRFHTVERPFVCRICGDGFTTHSDLKAHWKIHQGETPNVGSSSGKVVPDSASHKKPLVIHSEEGKEGVKRSFKCDICDEAFQNFGLLVRHAFSHKKNMSFESSAFGDPLQHQTQNNIDISVEDVQEEVYIIP